MPTYRPPKTTGGTGIAIRGDNISTESAVSAAHVSEPCVFRGLVVKTDGTNDVTITVFDNTAASGTTLLPAAFDILGTAKLWGFSFGNDGGPVASTGIYVEVTVAGGGSAAVQVLYDKGYFD